MTTLIGRSLGRYDITDHIGEGGMGVVYRAHDTRLGRDVAIKVINEAALGNRTRIQRFKREAQSVARPSHPNILEIHDFGTEDDVIFAVMELLDGADLRRHLNMGRIPVRNAIKMARQAAEGLAAAHSHGVIHRDIKPENLFLTRDGRLKILDFGLAHLRAPHGTDTSITDTTMSLTDAGTVLGTLRYMSPEQIRGQEIDSTSDIFSLGCVTYEMVTGIHPFLRKTKADTISAILHEDPEPMGNLRPNVSPSLDDIVLRCLEKQPSDRFHSAHDLGCSLQAIGETRSRSGGVIVRRALPKARTLGAVAVGAIIMMVVIFGMQQVGGSLSSPAKLPESLHLAIVPFSTVDGSGETRAMADGLAATIARGISRLEPFSGGRMWIVEPEDSFSDSTIDCESMRTTFNVSVCLEGAYERRDDDLSLTLELVDAESGALIDSEVIENPFSNIAVFQSEPILAVARLLLLHTPDGIAREIETAPTNVTPAYIAKLQGTGLLISNTDPEVTIAAVNLLEQAVAADPLYAEAWSALGEGCRRRFRETDDRSWLDRGYEAANQAINRRPSAAAFRVLANIHAADKDWGSEINALFAATRAEPRGAESFQMLGKALRKDHRYNEAVNALQRAINLRPGYWIYHHDLANLYFSRGEYDSAANHWRQVTDCAPLYDGGYANLGIVDFVLENTGAAQANFERAIELNPDTNENTYLNLGSLYFADARYADAAAMFERALELNDASYFTWGNLGFSLAHGLQPDRAESALRQAVILGQAHLQDRPDDPQVFTDLAGYHAELGDEEDARGCLKKAIDLRPNDPQVLAAIAETYEDLGDREQALEWVNHAFKAGAMPSRFENRPTLRSLIGDHRYQALKTGANRRTGSDPAL